MGEGRRGLKSKSKSSSVRIKPHHYRDKVQEGLGSSTARPALLSAWRTRV